MKKIAILCMFILSLFCGCSCRMVYKPLKQSEIISYVEQKIYEETGDKVTAKIISKESLQLEPGCTSCINFGGDLIIGGHKYELEIIDQNDPSIVASGTYKDGYYVDDGFSAASFEHNYYWEKALSEFENDNFDIVLNKKINNYYIYKGRSSYKRIYLAIFINSLNYDDINDMIIELESKMNAYYKYKIDVEFYVFIYKNQDTFNNEKISCTNSEYYENSTDTILNECIENKIKVVDKINNFDYEFFMKDEPSNDESFMYYVYAYKYKYYAYKYEGYEYNNSVITELDLLGVN